MGGAFSDPRSTRPMAKPLCSLEPNPASHEQRCMPPQSAHTLESTERGTESTTGHPGVFTAPTCIKDVGDHDVDAQRPHLAPTLQQAYVPVHHAHALRQAVGRCCLAGHVAEALVEVAGHLASVGQCSLVMGGWEWGGFLTS